MNTETEIRAAMDSFRDAVLAGDVDALMGHYAPDVVVFNGAPPFPRRGANEYRKCWEAFFSMFAATPKADYENLDIAAGTDMAVARFVNHITGEDRNGQVFDKQICITLVLRKTASRWLVMHEHVSLAGTPGPA